MAVPNSNNATTLGAVILAGVAVGIYSDFNDAIEKTVKLSAEYKPVKNELYDKAYNKYIKIYKQLREVMSE